MSWLEKEERRVEGLTSSTGAILDTAQEELLKVLLHLYSFPTPRPQGAPAPPLTSCWLQQMLQ